MHRIDSATATADHKFTEGDPTIPIAATTVTADWLNAVQEEIAAVITESGEELDKSDNAQLLAAILTLASGRVGARSVLAGPGLTGGGSLSEDRTISTDVTWSATAVYDHAILIMRNGEVYAWLQPSGPSTTAGVKDPAVAGSEAYWRHIHAIDPFAEMFRKSWIGIPRPWRSTTLPAGYVWANGGLVLFEDYPEIEEIYNDNGFAGMLLPYDADEETIAANLGKWRPNASNPTGLFVPSLGGQFSRAWVPGSGTAGGTNAAGLPSLSGSLSNMTIPVSNASSGSGAVGSWSGHKSAANNSALATGGSGHVWDGLSFNASTQNSIYGNSPTVMPPSIDVPHAIYLGVTA